ncbi:MAG TPA: S41 family peptidase [Candidatus Obscuribacterales bacterium]
MVERKRATRLGIPLVLCLLFFAVQCWLLAGGSKNQPAKILIADTSDVRVPAFIAQGQKTNVMPSVLYNRAYRLIKDQFFNQKFHGCGVVACTGTQDWSRWEHMYDGKLKTQEDAHKAIETMLASLGDPYTRFLDVEAFDEEKAQIEAHLFGVGMQLGMNKEHKVVVIAPIEGTPAFEANVQPGDEIAEVDNKPVKGQSLDQVVKQIRGKINTKVAITFLRKGERRKVTLTRAEIPIKAVANAEILPGNIGYIRLDSFISSKANQEMRDALKKLHNADGLIIDLRNNPGGLLSNAIEIANMFLDHGVIVSTIDSEGYKIPTNAAHNPISRQPMVVLINQGSASASEILSGALRDNDRAKLVGQKTFGKGLVQAIQRLDDGSGINVTIARYLTPNDVDIHKLGISPDKDCEVALKDDDYTKGKGPWWIDLTYTNFKKSPRDGKDLQLVKAMEVLKKQISSTGDRTASIQHTQKN